MAVLRPDLTPILVTLKANDWIIVDERENGILENYEGKYHLYTKTHLYMFHHIGNCEFNRIRIDLNLIENIQRGTDECEHYIVKK